MSIICKTCGNVIKDISCTRCPRCFSILKQKPNCSDCKGCSLKVKVCNNK